MTTIVSQLAVGDVLPNLGIDVTAKLIAGGAIATRDYQDVHHDKARAQELGSPDIFMNILTTNGLVGRYVTDWAGVGASLKKISIRLGAPNYPGDYMLIQGTVTAVDKVTGEVEIAIRGSNSLGDHATGTVFVILPAPAG